jgi:hypothetical protein
VTSSRGHSSTAGWLVWIRAVVAAVGLGIYADVGEYAPGVLNTVPLYAFPWVLLAVLWGVAARERAIAAVAGSAGIICGLVSWVVYKRIAYGQSSVAGFLRDELWHWLALALLVGSVFGFAGALLSASSAMREVGWGLVAAAGFVEGGAVICLMWVRHRAAGSADLVPVAEVAISVGVIVLALDKCQPRALVAWALTATAVGFPLGLAVFGRTV